jgi:hypothetical protein
LKPRFLGLAYFETLIIQVWNLVWQLRIQALDSGSVFQSIN